MIYKLFYSSPGMQNPLPRYALIEMLWHYWH